MPFTRTLLIPFLAGMMLTSCLSRNTPPILNGSKSAEDVSVKADQSLWKGCGYLSPIPNADPDRCHALGTFDTEEACLKSVDNWKSRQVVGHPIS
ncbi:MAG: hypothetical protein V3V30_09005, partial [Parvularculaceae bacterium]